MPPVGLEPTISAGERPQTYASDRLATKTGISYSWRAQIMFDRHLYLVIIDNVSFFGRGFMSWNVCTLIIVV